MGLVYLCSLPCKREDTPDDRCCVACGERTTCPHPYCDHMRTMEQVVKDCIHVWVKDAEEDS